MKLLLLEDDFLVARSMQRLLRLLGHNASHVTNCRDGKLAIGIEGQFDAVIADLGLADGESGLELLDWIRIHQPDIQRVLTSGSSFRPIGFIEHPPMDVYLPKPFAAGDLQRVLDGNPTQRPPKEKNTAS